MSLYPNLDDLLELRHATHTLGLSSHHLVNSSFSGLYASVFRGTGINFEEVREYREGDDIRNMDWKVTARTNKPHLKVYREERERSVMLCVDKGPHMEFGTRGTFKNIQAARTAALIGWAASRMHDRVGGLVFGDLTLGLQYFRPQRDRQSLWRLLKVMSTPRKTEMWGQPPHPSHEASIATGRSVEMGDVTTKIMGAGEVSPNKVNSLADAMQRATTGLSSGSLVFIIADLNRDIVGLELLLGSLIQRHTLVLMPIDDPADWHMPNMGRMIFVGSNGELVEVDTSDNNGRAKYQQIWHERRQALLSLVHRFGIFFLPIRTDNDIHNTLLRGLEERSRWRTL